MYSLIVCNIDISKIPALPEVLECVSVAFQIVPDHQKINEVVKAGIVSTEPTMIGVLMRNYSSK